VIRRLGTPVFAALVLAGGCRLNYDLLDDIEGGAGGGSGDAGSSFTLTAGAPNQAGAPSGRGGASGGGTGLAGEAGAQTGVLDAGVTATAGTSGDGGGLAGGGGVAGETPSGGGAFESAGAPGTGGTATGGVSSGGAETGGVPTGGVSSGGAEVGGGPTGGTATGAVSGGGAETGGGPTGGSTTGGVSSGGAETGGASAGGSTTGGVSSGGTETGGASAGGSGGQAGGSGGFAGASSLGDCQTKTYDTAQYLFCADEISWTEARDGCASVGMHLVRIDDAAENQWVYDNVYDTGSATNGIWIGASQLLVTGEWRWTDGTLFWLGGSGGSPQGGLFNAWYPAQPSSSSHNACVMIDSNNASTNWTSTGCASSNVFVCEP
jgi:hypothetical protein